jgi:hypothetical protein
VRACVRAPMASPLILLRKQTPGVMRTVGAHAHAGIKLGRGREWRRR